MLLTLENKPRTEEQRRGWYPFVRAGLCGIVLALVSATGCGIGDQCTAGDRRCNGAEIEECTTHPSGTAVSGDPPSATHYKSSPNTWYAQGSCGAPGLCQTGSYVDEYKVTKADAFCSLDPAPDDACGNASSYVCSGAAPSSTLVTCRAGFATERQACASCNDSLYDCKGGVYASCAIDGDCAAGLHCDKNTCEMACACPEGSACASCNVLDERTEGPTQGAPSTWICRAGSCFQQFTQ